MEGYNYKDSISFSPDGKTIASGSDDKTVRLLDVASGKEIRRIEGHTSNVSSVSFSPDGKTIASGAAGMHYPITDSDNTVRLWDVASGKEIRRMEGHTSLVTSLSFSPDGKTIASGSSDSSVRLWDVASGKEIRRMEGHFEEVRSVSFSPDGKTVVSGSYGETVRLWDVASGKEIRRIEGHTSDVSSVSFSPGGKTIASGLIDNTVRLWDTANEKEIRCMEGHTNLVISVSFSPDGKIIASVANDNTIRLWDAVSGKEIRRMEGHTIYVSSVSFSPNGKTVVSGSYDETVRLWDAATGKEIRLMRGHSEEVMSVNFSTDGKSIASGSRDKTVRLWDTATGKEIRRMKGHTSNVNSVCFSPDGKSIASGANDNTVRLWDAATGKEIRRMKGHTSDVNSVCFSSDGKIIASGAADNTLRMWDVESGKMIKVFISGQRGNWLSWDIKKNMCMRYDDGTFLVYKDKFGAFLPVMPLMSEGKSILEVYSAPDILNTHDGELTEFNINIRNNGKKRVYWVNIISILLTSPKGKEDSPFVFYQPSIVGKIEPNATIEMPCKVSAKSNYTNPKGQSAVLPLKITSAHGEPITLNIPVKTRVPEFQLIQAKLQKTSLLLTLKNSGEQDLKAETYFYARLAGSDLDTFIKTLVKAGETFNLSFAVPSSLKIPKKPTVELSAKKFTAPFHVWEFAPQPVILPTPAWQLYALLSVLVGAILTGVYYLYSYRHPIVMRISAAPESLLLTPLEELLRTQMLLKRTRRLDWVLDEVKIQKDRLKQAIAFYKSSDPQFRCKTLTEFMEVVCEPLPHVAVKLFRLKMNPDFMLNMDQCIMAFPEPEMSAAHVWAQLKQNNEIRHTTCMIISTSARQQAELRKVSLDPANWFVTPDNRELTGLLLSPDATDAFACLISSQIGFSRISPYQTRSGVNKEGVFFGRTQILAHIMQREPANYLIIGGRQIGKSSLLKAIERRYWNDPDMECHYLVLSGEDIREHLAKEMNLALDTDWRELSLHIGKTEGGRRRLFLIDEADKFVAAEARKDYATLHLFRESLDRIRRDCDMKQ